MPELEEGTGHKTKLQRAVVIELVMYGVMSPPAVCVEEQHVFSFTLGPWFS